MRSVVRIFLVVVLSVAVGIGVLQAQTVVGTGTGGNIPANAPAANSGTFTSDATMNGGGTVASGNAVTVILKGLEHNWAGDLIATLSYLDSQGKVVVSANLFYRIGLSSNQPEGTWAAFGVPGQVGDNYTFNSDASGNIWGVAAGLGYADVIPGLQTDEVNNGQYFPSDAGGASNNLSYAFAGLDIGSGTWRLTITDVSDHASEGSSVSNIGSIVGWEIDIQTPPSFAVTASPNAQTIVAGNTANYTVSVSPASGFTGPVALSSVGLPTGATAAFYPSSVAISGIAAATSSLMVSTNTALAAGNYNFTITGQSGSITQSHSATLVVSSTANTLTVNPSSGSGTSQTLTFTFTAPNQAQEQILFNTSLSAAGSCYVYYYLSSNTLNLLSDQGNSSQSATPGTSTTLSNSQCSVAMSGVAVSQSGNTITITLPITFSSAFAGSKNIYANTVSTSNQPGTWQQIGTWTVPGSGAGSFAISASPSSQEIVAGSGANYLVTVSPLNGFTGSVSLSANGLPNGATGTFTPNPIAISGTAAGNFSLLVSTNTSVTPGNYNFTIIGQSASIQQSTPATLYVLAPNSFSVTPSSGSGTSQTFAFGFNAPSQTQEHLVFNTSLSAPGSCYVYYYLPSNTLNLLNDQANGLQSATPGTSATLLNSQCSIAMSGVMVSQSGNTVTITLPITFSAGFSGARNIYAAIVNTSNQPSTWQQVGAWTP